MTLSFAPRPKLYTFVFDDAAIAQQWYKVMLFECSNRMVGTKVSAVLLVCVTADDCVVVRAHACVCLFVLVASSSS